jgi:hypothetical protein
MKKSYLPALLFFITLGLATETHAAAPTAHNPIAVEEAVREFFKDAPAMVEIARCESKFRQFTDAGNPLRSAGMIGVFQFYESIHSSAATALGFDLATLEGNLGYAKHVYSTEHTTPWNGSRYCWETAVTTPVPAAAAKTVAITAKSNPTRADLEKQIALLTQLITLLQKQLQTKLAQK